MSLTDTKVRNAKPGIKPIKMFDGGGLFLLITPQGGKGWRFKYRFDGKEKLISFGTYPEISLVDARNMREKARSFVAKKVDPSVVRKEERKERAAAVENTFENVAREWHTKNSKKWVASHGDQVLRRLEVNIFPIIGSMPISDIKPLDMLGALQKVEARDAIETARRIKQSCGQVFRYAVATGRAERDITADLRDALSPVVRTHHAAITDPDEVAGLLRAIDDYKGYKVVKCALQIAPLVFVRPGELRKAEWSEVDFDKAEWNIPPERMKMKQAHLVPLSSQAISILKVLYNLTKSGTYLFPSIRSVAQPISDNTINAALRRLGYEKDEMTGHGFRAMARTILDEILQVRPDFIEHQLAHAVRDPNGRAYNRTAHLAERKKMMQLWADYLDGLKKGNQEIPLQKQA